MLLSALVELKCLLQRTSRMGVDFLHETPKTKSKNAAGSASPILVLMYHAVHATTDTWEEQAPADRWYAVTGEQFAEQMACLANQHETVLLEEFLAGRAAKSSVVVTFDDGHESNFSVAFPILQRFKLRAEFFVTVSRVGQPGYMTWGQLAEMRDAGMSIQSHGFDHRPMTGLSDAELAEDLKSSRDMLSHKLGREARYLALPGGFVDKRVYSAALSAGYEAVCNSEPGLARPAKIIPRVAIMHSTSRADFQRLLEAKRLTILKSSLRRAAAKAAKAVIGVERYEAMKQLGLRRSPDSTK